jgi:hypothetical protein
MKTAICFIAALVLAGDSSANPNRYELRSLAGANLNLHPLFSWWTFASQTTNHPLDITIVSPDKLAAVSNIWLHLPPRPLPDWIEISANEGNIAVSGDMWKVDATLAPAPMIIKHQVIYLRHPPVKEIQDFKNARAQFLALENGQSLNGPVAPTPPILQPNTKINYPGTIKTSDGKVIGASGGTATVENEVATSAAISNNVERANQKQLDNLRDYLGTFNSTTVYTLDHFALRTGKQIDGIDVYDLGAVPGLNY